MANAKRDQNDVPTLLAGLETNGSTLVLIQANPTTHALLVATSTVGVDYGPVNSPRDENSVPALMGVSSSDGVTPVVIYATSDGKLLIQ